jgi:hypothetical protein
MGLSFKKISVSINAKTIETSAAVALKDQITYTQSFGGTKINQHLSFIIEQKGTS